MRKSQALKTILRHQEAAGAKPDLKKALNIYSALTRYGTVTISEEGLRNFLEKN